MTPSEEDLRASARRLLGDVVSDTLDRAGIAALVRKHFPSCRCWKRRAQLNKLHLQLVGRRHDEPRS